MSWFPGFPPGLPWTLEPPGLPWVGHTVSLWRALKPGEKRKTVTKAAFDLIGEESCAPAVVKLLSGAKDGRGSFDA